MEAKLENTIVLTGDMSDKVLKAFDSALLGRFGTQMTYLVDQIDELRTETDQIRSVLGETASIKDCMALKDLTQDVAQELNAKWLVLAEVSESLRECKATISADSALNGSLRQQIDVLAVADKGFSQQIDALTECDESLVQRIDALAESNKSLALQIDILTKSEKSLGKRIDALNESDQSLAQRITASDTSVGRQLDALTKSIDTRIGDAASEMSSTRRCVEAFDAELYAANASLAKFVEAVGDVDDIRRQVTSHQGMMKQVMEALDLESHARKTAEGSMVQRIDALAESGKSLARQADFLTRSNNSLGQWIETAEAALTAGRSALEGALAKQVEARLAAEAVREDLESRLVSLDRTVSADSALKESLRQRTDALTLCGESMVQRIDALTKSDKSLALQIEILTESENSLGQRIDSLKESDQSLAQRTTASDTSTIQQLDGLNKSIWSMLQQIDALAESNKSFALQMNTLTESDQSLGQQIDALNKSSQSFSLQLYATNASLAKVIGMVGNAEQRQRHAESYQSPSSQNSAQIPEGDALFQSPGHDT
jgi:chromosome segregation ATPase